MQDDNKTKMINVIGIIGGGQLGRMMSHAAQSLGYKTVILTNDKYSPAQFTSNQTIIGDYNDKRILKKFTNLIDIATIEFENIPTTTIDFIAKNKEVYPSVNVLKITQNRLLEKNFLLNNNIKTTDFVAINSLSELQNKLAIFGKSILKTATLGYDGKGQFILEHQKLTEELWSKITNYNNEFILEKFCNFLGEISVIVARSINGEIACYEPLWNIHKNSILDKSIYPAQITDETKNNAQNIAIKIAEKLDLQGILAVEFFVLHNGELLVNELAPRPHNSGHFSMNASYTSQFEQVVRAISGLPLGDVRFHSQGFMKNLIGGEIFNIQDFINNKMAKIHLYDKDEAREGRKMGHINIIEEKTNMYSSAK